MFVSISSQATKLLHDYREEYVKHGFPPRRQLSYKANSQEEVTSCRELQAVGLLTPGLKHTWYLSEAGVDWVMANRVDV